MKNTLNCLIAIFQENNVNYEINQSNDADSFAVTILSEKSDRKINIDWYEGGYDLHFSINDFWCFCYHAPEESESLLAIVVNLINEKIVGIKIERGDYVGDHLVAIDELENYLKKQMTSISYSNENGLLKNKKYKFLIRSFKGSKDQDIIGECE